ncbi:response regulator transcription factor [Sulfurimonas sp. HSL-3221]|uniref:response regulator transcription factor n=1 Tax=Sulfurimonadaceae TaxID=2771471 RepID=UPI001E3412C6|nr:response regulator transcription factor [Sulfurimonas sp. HSL-3221]UFS61868.1 response regulator transcription factor [Sulfurimonas sp. HSL-3221]
MTKRVMLIEDDRAMQALIGGYLTDYGYSVRSFNDPRSAIEALKQHKEGFDIVILDLMLPGMDGFDAAKTIKAVSDIPIIISSARGDIGNKIHGFELGVDDYLAKPYEPRELILRIEAVLRRYGNAPQLQVSDFTVDEQSRTVSMEGYPVDLTPVEFEIFLFLLKNRGNNVSREQIVHATSLEPETKGRTVDMHISNIRLKIGDSAKSPRYIKSVWGIGYRFIG